MIRVLAVLLFVVSSASALTQQESKLLNRVTAAYFDHDGVHYHIKYMAGKPQYKFFEFTYVKWRSFPIRITQADTRNGITKRMHVKLECDTAYRFKEGHKWSQWKQGGEFQLTWFNGQIIYDQKGMHYKPNIPAMLKNYSKPSGGGAVTRVKKKTSNGLPPGVRRMPAKSKRTPVTK